MKVAPITLKAANEYIKANHRHHGSTRGHKFSIAAHDDDGNVIGVVVVGRPVARGLDDGHTAEVTRLCTDGTPNACSMLYAAAWRACKAMGYRRLYTYILDSEPGISLKAAGWINEGMTAGGSWDTPSRRRKDTAPIVPKQRWRAA